MAAHRRSVRDSSFHTDGCFCYRKSKHLNWHTKRKKMTLRGGEGLTTAHWLSTMPCYFTAHCMWLANQLQRMGVLSEIANCTLREWSVVVLCFIYRRCTYWETDGYSFCNFALQHLVQLIKHRGWKQATKKKTKEVKNWNEKLKWEHNKRGEDKFWPLTVVYRQRLQQELQHSERCVTGWAGLV